MLTTTPGACGKGACHGARTGRLGGCGDSDDDGGGSGNGTEGGSEGGGSQGGEGGGGEGGGGKDGDHVPANNIQNRAAASDANGGEQGRCARMKWKS